MKKILGGFVLVALVFCAGWWTAIVSNNKSTDDAETLRMINVVYQRQLSFEKRTEPIFVWADEKLREELSSKALHVQIWPDGKMRLVEKR